jgi:hypothetical protein
MTPAPAAITAELMEHADGRPVAYIDATAVAVFTYQQPDGTYVIDIHTRDDTARERLLLLLDSKLLRSGPDGHGAGPACQAAQPRGATDGNCAPGTHPDEGTSGGTSRTAA